MAVLPVKKMTIFALQKSNANIISALQKYGGVQINDLSTAPNLPDGILSCAIDDDNKLSGYNADLDNLFNAIKFLGTYDDTKKGFLSPRPNLSYDEVDDILTDLDTYLKLSKYANDLEHNLFTLSSQKAKIIANMDHLKPWLTLNCPVNIIKDTKHTIITTGSIPSTEWVSFIDDQSDMSTLHLEEISSDSENIYIFVACHELEMEGLMKSLQKASFTKATFPKSEGSPSEIYDSLKDDLISLDEKFDELIKSATEFSSNIPDIKKCYDALMLKRDMREVALKFGATDYTVYISGWVPSARVEEVTSLINSVTSSVEIIFTDPDKSETPPTFIENNAIVEPFESITSMYATPNAYERDPNPVMAPFYFIFFGMMVSDAGYGLVLAALAMLLYKLTKPEKNSGKLILVIALGGVSTFLWGVLFGGWFGFQLTPLWFAPLENPLLMLIVCFGLGLVQIMTGLVLKTRIDIENKGFIYAFIKDISWLMLFTGLLLFASNMIGSSPVFEILSSIGTYILIFAAGLLVLGSAGIAFIEKLKGLEKKSILKVIITFISSIFSGVMALYDITGFLSDILSYSRLFALGLATGVIGMVVNTMMGMMTNGLGWIFVPIVFVGGHLFNLVVNALGAYVHACRLQYIEFFGRFLEGGGYPFMPFTVKTKYHRINY